MKEKFVIKARDDARVPMYMRLHPDLIKRLNTLAKNTGVSRADIIQQGLEFALMHLEVKK